MMWLSGRPVWAAKAGVLPAVLISWLAVNGCQRYERKPLELEAHRAALEQRAADMDAQLAAFAAALNTRDDGRPAQAFDLADGISLAEAEVAALFYNAELRIARMEAGIALATREHAGLWEDPIFGFDGAEILSPSGPFQFGLSMSITIPVSGRLEVEKQHASAAYEVALREIVDAEWHLRAVLRRVWAQWSATHASIDVATEMLAGLEAVAALADRLREFGEITRAEARVFSMAVTSARRELAELEMQAAEQRSTLLLMMGLPAHAQVALVPGVSGVIATDLPTMPADPDQHLIAHNPTLAVRRAAYQVAEREVELEIRRQYPDIEIGAGYGNEDDDRLLLGVSMPIPVLNANRGAIAEARARRQRARAVAEATFEKLSSDLHRAIDQHERLTRQRAELAAEAVELAAAQLDELTRLAELGEIDTLLLLQSLQTMRDARLQSQELLTRQQLAAIDITELLGPPQPQKPAPVDVNTKITSSKSGDER